MAKEFAWYVSLSFHTLTPYFHVQTLHATDMVVSLPPNLTLGQLKNEIVERKHHEAKSLHTAYGGGREAPTAHVRGVCCIKCFNFFNSLIFNYVLKYIYGSLFVVLFSYLYFFNIIFRD